MNFSASVVVADSTFVSGARRMAVDLANRLEFPAERAGKVAIVATEMATNLVKHTGAGEIIVTSVDSGTVKGIELIALDKGPGIADVSECFRDGYSTTGSAGTGLGAIARLSDSFDIYTQPGRGTAISARLWGSTPPPEKTASTKVDIVGFSIPQTGETVSGDAWAVRQLPGGCTILTVDGLGHGELAAEAARAAVECFRGAAELSPVDLLPRIHDALRQTRGAAGAVAEIDLESHQVRFSGIGNISAFIAAPERTQNLVSMNGILGHETRTVRQFSYPWPLGAMLILCSDGLSTRTNLSGLPGLSNKSCGIIAGVLYREYTRRRDDATVVVARERPAV